MKCNKCETEKRSSFFCFVCSKCGYIELYADCPKDIVVE